MGNPGKLRYEAPVVVEVAVVAVHVGGVSAIISADEVFIAFLNAPGRARRNRRIKAPGNHTVIRFDFHRVSFVDNSKETPNNTLVAATHNTRESGSK